MLKQTGRGCWYCCKLRTACAAVDIYSGYFKYSDDHLWEIVWNPGWNAKDRRDILD